MIRATLINENNQFQSGNEALIEQWRRGPNEVLWLDIQDEPPEKISAMLKQFGAHVLAIEDSLRHRHPPKIEFFENQLFIVYRGIKCRDDELVFQHQQVSLFVEHNLIISVHTSESQGINKTLDELETLKLKLPLNIAIQIMKNSSQVYLDELLDFDGHLSELEDKLQKSGNDVLLSELTSYKSKLIKLIRTFKYHHTITQALINETDQHDYLNADSHTHAITDLNDRFDRLVTLSQMHYDISGDLIDGYLSISAHQLNVTMRVLTVITAIFVPLSFLAGLYGMNFEYIPELKVRYGYFYLLGGMFLVATCLIYLFKTKLNSPICDNKTPANKLSFQL